MKTGVVSGCAWTKALKKKTKTLKKLIISIEKTNISIKKLIISIEKTNISIKNSSFL